jgi:hypothetical protein
MKQKCSDGCEDKRRWGTMEVGSRGVRDVIAETGGTIEASRW